MTNATSDERNPIKSYKILYEHYRTVAYERANPFRPEDAIREMDSNFGRVLPTNFDARILDVGCGMGQFLHYLKSKGYRDLMGVEISPEQVEFCQRNVTPNVMLTSDTVSFLTERPASWDCILLKDVIEHLPRRQVIPTLSAIFAALVPGGTVIIETGNMASASGAYMRYIDFTHESGFTEISLQQVLRAVGFDQIEVSGNSPFIYSWRSYLRVALLRTWQGFRRLIFRLERGWDAAPQVLSQVLIAQARRPREESQ